MPETLDALLRDFLHWLGSAPRPYHEVIAAWGTSCPQLPVWEEANERRLIERTCQPGAKATVTVTQRGRDFLQRC
ncbi:MAG: hypothetical protein AAF581_14945 [Planctomycetota bacterium]